MGLSSLCLGSLISEHDNRADRLALMHEIESLVDLLQLEDVCDHRIDFDLSVHVPVDDFRHIRAAARAAEGRSLPDAAGHQLERPGGDFLAGLRDPDNDRDAPAAMARFEGLPHHGGVAGAIEGVVGAAVREPDQMLDDVTDLGRVDEMRHAKTAAPILLGIVDVNADDLVGAHHLRALDDIEPDAAETEYDDVGARCHLGGIDHGADARRHPATDVAALVERRVLANLCHRDFWQHGKVREGRAAHVVVDRLAPIAEARGTVRHQPLALGGADGGTKIGLAAQAAFTLAAFRRVERNHVIAGLDRRHARPDLADDTGALMTEDRRKDSFAVKAIERVSVGVANPGRLYFDANLAGLRAFQIDLN